MNVTDYSFGKNRKNLNKNISRTTFTSEIKYLNLSGILVRVFNHILK